jgi:hypothetical protein
MLTNQRRQYFKRWRLYEKESFFGTVICYEIENLVKIERYFRPDERNSLNNLILDLYFDYEWTGEPLTARQISIIYWVDHTTVDRILANAKNNIKNAMEKSWLKKSTISENLSIFI